MNSTIRELVNQLWFVVIDLNTNLDYETKIGILHTIARHTGISVDDLWEKSNNVNFDEFQLV